MDKDTSMALGRITKMRDDLRDRPISSSEAAAIFANPAAGMARVYRDLMVHRTLTPEQDEELTRLTWPIDATVLGERMSDAEQCNFMVAYHLGWKTVSAQEAADQIGCTKENIYRLIKDGRLKAEKWDGEWRVWDSSIKTYIYMSK